MAEPRQLNEDDIRAAGGLARSDVDQQFLESRGMVSTDAITEDLLNERGVAFDDEVISKEDDPGDFTLIFNNKLI